MDKLIISGTDNRGKPRQNWADSLAGLNDEEFVKQAEQCIWLSAYANNNPRSDYHWMADACYDEAKRRENLKLYRKAYHQACKSAGHRSGYEDEFGDDD